MSDFGKLVTEYKDLLQVSIALLALVVSLVSLQRSRRMQSKQLQLEAKTAALSSANLGKLHAEEQMLPVLIFLELSGHISVLTRTVDHANPTWMRRGEEGAFDDYEISHASLNHEAYDSSKSRIQDIELRIALGSYYQTLTAFNSRGEELLNKGTMVLSAVHQFLRDAALLLRTAHQLMYDVHSRISEDVLAQERVRLAEESWSEGRPYSLTVERASHLDVTALLRLGSVIEEEGINAIDLERYPSPAYIASLYEAVFGRTLWVDWTDNLTNE